MSRYFSSYSRIVSISSIVFINEDNEIYNKSCNFTITLRDVHVKPDMIDRGISKKVLTVGPEYDPPKGGIAKVLGSYSRIISPFRFVKTYRQGSNPLSQLLLLGWSWLKFSYLCMFGGVRIIHIHCCSNNSFWRKSLFVCTGKAFGKKVILHIHGGGFEQFAKVHQKAVSRIIRRADVIAALSSSWKEYFERTFSPKKVTVLPNIVEEPMKLTEKAESAVGIFLGNINEPKGIFDLLAAIASHKEELRGKFFLHICGKGEENRLMNIIAENGLGGIVCYDGWVAGERKASLMSMANIYILPSYAEGLPISILEAMTYGMAIISTPVGGIPEIVRQNENGILIAPGDTEALSNAILKLAEDKACRYDMGRRSIEIVQPYLPKNVERHLNILYSELSKI